MGTQNYLKHSDLEKPLGPNMHKHMWYVQCINLYMCAHLTCIYVHTVGCFLDTQKMSGFSINYNLKVNLEHVRYQ